MLVSPPRMHIFGWNRFRNELFGSNVVRGETDPVVHQGCSLQLVDKIEKSVAYRTFPGGKARRTRSLLLLRIA
jgi:hypothetical protein